MLGVPTRSDVLKCKYLLAVCPRLIISIRFNKNVIWTAIGSQTLVRLCLSRVCKDICTVYHKKYAHGFCFAVLGCGYTLTDFPISIRLTSLALWQSNDCPSTSKATLMNMDRYFIWIHYERLHNHNKAKHNKTVCIFLGIYCSPPVEIGVHPGASVHWMALPVLNSLRPRQMDAISQTPFSNAFSWMKMFEFRLKFHWNLFPRVQLTIFQHWFR